VRIALKPPYSERWHTGYLLLNKRHDRRMVILYNNAYDRSSVNYARYLMEVKLGRYLTPEEEVDHKNDNKRDDRESNFQILSPRANRAKENRRRAS